MSGPSSSPPGSVAPHNASSNISLINILKKKNWHSLQQLLLEVETFRLLTKLNNDYIMSTEKLQLPLKLTSAAMALHHSKLV